MSSLLRMDNFPGRLEWPPLDDPGVLGAGRAHYVDCHFLLRPAMEPEKSFDGLESSFAPLSSTNVRSLSIPCGGQGHRDGTGTR